MTRLPDPGHGLPTREERRQKRRDEWLRKIEGAPERKSEAEVTRENRQSLRRTFLVFADQATADRILADVSATPPIEDDHHAVLVGPQVQGQLASDGRVAISYGWQEAARDWLEAVLDGVTGVEVRDDLPADWTPASGES